MSFLHEGIQALQELLFPARCLGCTEQLSSSHPPLLCSDCHHGASAISPPFCTCCGTPLYIGDNHLCLSCLEKPLALTKARSSSNFKFGNLLLFLINTCYLEGYNQYSMETQLCL